MGSRCTRGQVLQGSVTICGRLDFGLTPRRMWDLWEIFKQR